MKISLDLHHDFSGQHLALVVQKLPAGTPFGCKSDDGTCPVPADWIVFLADETDANNGRVALACQEHVAGMMWNLCAPP